MLLHRQVVQQVLATGAQASQGQLATATATLRDTAKAGVVDALGTVYLFDGYIDCVHGFAGLVLLGITHSGL